MWTSNHQLPPLPDLPPKEAADEEIINEKKDTAEEKVEIEERWACSLASDTTVEVTPLKETVYNINHVDKQDIM